MPNFFYTDANGQKQGAISPSQLKELVAQGIITPDTLLETDTGHKGKAGQIKGLFNVPVQSSTLSVNRATPIPSNVPMVDTEEDSESDDYDDDYDHERIASLHRLSTWSILFFLLLMFIGQQIMPMGGMGSPTFLRIFFGVAAIGFWSFSIVCVVRLARAILYNVATVVLFAICVCPIPLIFLPFSMTLVGVLMLLCMSVPLVCVYFRAGKILKQAGYKVGIIGVNMQEFGIDARIPEEVKTTICFVVIIAIFGFWLVPAYFSGARHTEQRTIRLTPDEIREADRFIAQFGNNAIVCYLDSGAMSPYVDANNKITDATSILKHLRYFVSRGADVNAKDNNNGFTPLHIAAALGCVEMVKFFVSSGADVNAKDNNFSVTPLHMVARDGSIEVAQFLVSQGADVTAKNVGNETPLDAAVRMGSREMVEYLITVMPLQTYRDNELGFSFRYPFGWQAEARTDSEMAVIAFRMARVDDDPPPVVRVTILFFEEEVPVEDVFNIEDYATARTDFIEEFEAMGAREINIKDFGVRKNGDREYLFWHFQHTTVHLPTGENRHVEQINAHFLHNDMLFNVTALDSQANFDKNRPIFDSIINSFQFD